MSASTRHDLRGLKCPMPIVQLNRIMKALSADEECAVVADDPAFCPDVNAWCKKTGHALVSCDCDGKGHESVAVIRKRA